MKQYKTKKDSELYYYFNANKEKRWIFRHRYYDSLGLRRERSRQGFTSENKAYKALLEVKSTILNGGIKQIEQENLTISQWLDIWFETKEKNWKVSTIYQRRRYIEGVIKPRIGGLKLSKLDAMTYERVFINELLKDYAPSSVKTYHDLVKIAVNAAVANETIRRNVLNSITILDNRKTKENFLSAKELKKLLKVGKEQANITNYTMLVLLADTGMRKGEAQGLRWQDINYKERTIKVERTRDNDGVRTPKTKRSFRTIEVDDKLMHQLKAYNNWCKQMMFSNGVKLTDNDFIFITSHGGRPISPNTFNRTLDILIKKSKVKRITPHGLRHTHATFLLSIGISVVTVAKRLGNTSQEIHRTYGHSDDEADKQAVIAYYTAMNS